MPKFNLRASSLIWASEASLATSSETQGQIVGTRESPKGRKNMARRKVKIAVLYFSSRHIFPPVWTFPRPHYLPLGLRGWSRENARQKCFYRYGSTLLERVSTHELGKFLYNFRGKKPVTDLRVFVLKVQARSPRLFHCLALISFFAKTENPVPRRSVFLCPETTRKR